MQSLNYNAAHFHDTFSKSEQEHIKSLVPDSVEVKTGMSTTAGVNVNKAQAV
jgi:hypothetical protein